MNITFENAITALGLLGLGGVIGTYFRILWERKNSALLKKQEFKETRYKCIILLLLCMLDFEKELPKLHRHGRTDINKIDDLINELKTEWNNMILFSSEDVLINMHSFIENPSQSSFKKVALSMRDDLWGGKLSSDKIKTLEFK